MKNLLLSVAVSTLTNFVFAQPKLTPTDAGSKVHFVIKNFGISVGGDFTGLKGFIEFEAANVTAAVINVTADAATVNTDNNKRDEHLKKDDYFDVAKYPTIHIVSSKIEKGSSINAYLFSGNLTIKGVTKPLKFPFTATKSGTGYLFAGNFDISRRDFNVGGGTFPLSENVKVSLSILAK